MKRRESGRIVFFGYLDTDGARTVGQSGRRRRSTRKEIITITGAAAVLVIHFAKGRVD